MFIQFIRGNWRKESTTAPSLLTKSCHDIDFLLWLFCSPHSCNNFTPHLPSSLSSTGHLAYLRKARKPASAGAATNCLSCDYERSCIYSAKKVYLERQLQKGDVSWPVSIVNPEIEDCYKTQGLSAASEKLLKTLAQDYDATTPRHEVERRPWFGRCVWECDNDVCDDQVVTLTWEDDPLSSQTSGSISRDLHSEIDGRKGRLAKTASFHMVAYTEAQCHRRGRVYGTTGEIVYDSKSISVYDFASGATKVHLPAQPGGGHGGGDAGLVRQFVNAVEAVKKGMAVQEAQEKFIGCSLEEMVRSHAVVFAAEEARREGKVVRWQEWWRREVEERLKVEKKEEA